MRMPVAAVSMATGLLFNAFPVFLRAVTKHGKRVQIVYTAIVKVSNGLPLLPRPARTTVDNFASFYYIHEKFDSSFYPQYIPRTDIPSAIRRGQYPGTSWLNLNTKPLDVL